MTHETVRPTSDHGFVATGVRTEEKTDAKEKMRMNSSIEPAAEVDCVGLYCPMPIAMTKEQIDAIGIGEILKVEADDPAAEEDIKRWAQRAGHEIVKFEKESGIMTFYIRRKK